MDRWDPDDIGKLVYDNDFDMSSSESQQLLYDACQLLKISEYVQLYQVECWIESFSVYMLSTAVDKKKRQFPVP